MLVLVGIDAGNLELPSLLELDEPLGLLQLKFSPSPLLFLPSPGCQASAGLLDEALFLGVHVHRVRAGRPRLGVRVDLVGQELAGVAAGRGRGEAEPLGTV